MVSPPTFAAFAKCHGIEHGSTRPSARTALPLTSNPLDHQRRCKVMLEASSLEAEKPLTHGFFWNNGAQRPTHCRDLCKRQQKHLALRAQGSGAVNVRLVILSRAVACSHNIPRLQVNYFYLSWRDRNLVSASGSVRVKGLWEGPRDGGSARPGDPPSALRSVALSPCPLLSGSGRFGVEGPAERRKDRCACNDLHSYCPA